MSMAGAFGICIAPLNRRSEGKVHWRLNRNLFGSGNIDDDPWWCMTPLDRSGWTWMNSFEQAYFTVPSICHSSSSSANISRFEMFEDGLI